MLHWGLRQKNISMSSAPPTWKVRPRSSQRLPQVTQQVREVGPGPGEESRTRLVTVEKRRREGGKDSEGRKLVMVT